MATQGYYTDYENKKPTEGTRPGVSEDFTERQRNRTGWGVQNVETEFTDKARKTTSNTLRYAGNRAQSYGRYLQDRSDELEQLPAVGKIAAKARRQVGQYIERSGKAARVISRGIASRRVENPTLPRFQVSLAMGWTGFLNILSFPIGVLALGAFASTAIVANIPGGETTAQIAAWMVGLEYFNIWVIAIGLYVLYAFLILTMFAGAYIQLKLGGLEPLDGQATVAKNLLFIAAFVASAGFPGTTFIPWIFGWLFIVWLYPN